MVFGGNKNANRDPDRHNGRIAEGNKNSKAARHEMKRDHQDRKRTPDTTKGRRDEATTSQDLADLRRQQPGRKR